jgi:hypothetical protein
MSRVIAVWALFKVVESVVLVLCVLIGNIIWLSFQGVIFTLSAQDISVAVLVSLAAVYYYFFAMGYIPLSFVAFVAERKFAGTRFQASTVNFFIFLLHSTVVFTLMSIWDERFIRSYFILSWPLGLFLVYWFCRKVEQFM